MRVNCRRNSRNDKTARQSGRFVRCRQCNDEGLRRGQGAKWGVHRDRLALRATGLSSSAFNSLRGRSTRMTPVVSLTVWDKCAILFYAIAWPARFVEAEVKHNEQMVIILSGRPHFEELSKIHHVRGALFQAFWICLTATLAGAGLGKALSAAAPNGTGVATIVAVVGTATLLWASLALQGWNIQSMKGQTLTERVNQWIFRTLYAVGTLLISLGSIWATS